MPRVTGLLTTVAGRRPKSRRIGVGLTVYYNPTNPNSFPGVGTTIYDLSGFGIHATKSESLGHEQIRGYFKNTSFLVSPPARIYVIPTTWAALTTTGGPGGLAIGKANYADGFSFSIWYKMDAADPVANNTRVIVTGDCFSLSTTLNLVTGVQTFTCTFQYEVAAIIYPRRFVIAKSMKLVGTRVGIYKNTWSNIIFAYDTASKTGILYVDTVALASTNAVPHESVINYRCPPWITLTYIRIGHYYLSTFWGGITYSFGKFGIIRMYKRALESSTISAIWESERVTYLGNSTTIFQIPTNNLVLSFTGNLLTENVTKNKGIIVGTGVNYINSNNGYTYFAERTAGRSVPLDCIRYTNHVPPNTITGDLTIHYWTKDPTTQSGGVWNGWHKSFSILKILGANSGIPGLWVYKSPVPTHRDQIYRIRHIFQLGSSQWGLFGINFGANVWYSVTIVYRAGIDITFYVNGEEEFNQINGPKVYPAPVIDYTKPLLLGRSDTSFLDSGVGANSDSYTTGREFSLARLYVYNRAVNDNEVWDIYNADKASFT